MIRTSSSMPVETSIKSQRLGATSLVPERLGKQVIATLISALLALQPALVQAQSVTPAVSAPAANQPAVGTAPNGIPLVDIVTPNGAGLSHNKYADFNVNDPGLILNNSNSETGISALGGVTPGNPNLVHSGAAKVILNEVTSGNRSALNGPIEVFGGRADVIVANPNGITCDGCGFINTPRATLTTGTPDINGDGRLGGFTVNGGDVTFGARGGNFAEGKGAVDLFDVVSRTVRVDGPVYGKDLRLTGGRNKFDYATGEAAALGAIAGAPELAIDGSALGAMQADSIKIIVTEKGAGVRMRADMAANAGEISLSSDGKITIGNASGSQGVSIRSGRSVEAGKVTSKKKVTVVAERGITLHSVAAEQDVELTGGSGLISVAGNLASLTNVHLTSAGSISASGIDAGGAISLNSASGSVALGGTAKSGGDLTVSAVTGSIGAGSLVSFGNMTLTAGLDIGVSGEMLAGGAVAATGRSLQLGTVASGVDMAATQVSPGGAIVLSGAGDLTLEATSGILTATSLLSAGPLIATASGIQAQDISSRSNIVLSGATAVSGQIQGGGTIRIDGESINAGSIVSGVDFVATAASRSGSIVLGSPGDLTINAGAGIVNAGALLSAGSLEVVSGSFTAQNVTGHGAVSLSGATNVNGRILSGGNVAINGAAIRAGAIVSGVDFAATATSSSGNVVLNSAGALNLTATSGSIDTGTLLSAGDMTLLAVQNIQANAVSRKAMKMNAGSAIALIGQSLAASAMQLNAGVIRADTLVSGVDFVASAASPTGTLMLGATGTLTVEAAAGSITAGSLLSAGDLVAHAALNLAYESLQSSGNASLAADQGAISLDKATRAAGNIALTTSTVDLSNNRGQIATAQTLAITAANVNLANSALTLGGLALNLSGSADLSNAQVSTVTGSGGQGDVNIRASTISTTATTALLMLWTALRQPFNLFGLGVSEESHGTSSYDWIGYRKVGVSGSWCQCDGRCRCSAASEPRQGASILCTDSGMPRRVGGVWSSALLGPRAAKAWP